MVTRRERAAFSDFRDLQQRSVSTVTRAVLVQGDVIEPGRRSLQLAGGVARLRGRHPLDLVLAVDFRWAESAGPQGRPAIAIVGYRYEFRRADGPMLLAYHWHPIGVSPVTGPHLHLGGSLGGFDLSKAHLPTGPVALQAVLRFAILDLGVAPLRADWRDLLTA